MHLHIYSLDTEVLYILAVAQKTTNLTLNLNLKFKGFQTSEIYAKLILSSIGVQ
jgi:hypothetical protein